MSRWTRVLAALLVALAFGAPAFAQGGGASSTGTIQGRVSDAQGAVLPGVTVTLSGAGVAGTPTVVTAETGSYRFPLLPPGTYDLEYTLGGFNTLKRTAIPISVGSTVELRVTDNGSGFGNGDPLGAAEPGHLGLAMMRERAELLDGTLDIETSELGTRVLVLVPLPTRSL